jgi:hypothetical protein
MSCAARSNAVRGRPASAPSPASLAASDTGVFVSIVRSALAAMALLLLAACYPPTTTHPVGTTAGLKLDPVLNGTWKADPASRDERGAFLHFLPKLDGSLTVLMVQTGDEPDGDWSLIELTNGKAGNNRYMNARLVMSNGKAEDDSPGGTIPLLYRFDSQGHLMLYMMNEDRTKAAIKAGQITGTIGKGDSGDAVITADPVALDKFMASPAALALFVKPFFTLHKID